MAIAAPDGVWPIVRKIIVTGGRDHDDPELVWRTLDKADPDVVIQGECETGADKYAREWCEHHGKPCIGMLAPWKALGKAAGPIRNGWMIKFNLPIAGAIAFKGGRGTQDMIRQAEEAGIKVHRVGWTTQQ